MKLVCRICVLLLLGILLVSCGNAGAGQTNGVVAQAKPQNVVDSKAATAKVAEVVAPSKLQDDAASNAGREEKETVPEEPGGSALADSQQTQTSPALEKSKAEAEEREFFLQLDVGGKLLASVSFRESTFPTEIEVKLGADDIARIKAGIYPRLSVKGTSSKISFPLKAANTTVPIKFLGRVENVKVCIQSTSTIVDGEFLADSVETYSYDISVSDVYYLAEAVRMMGTDYSEAARLYHSVGKNPLQVIGEEQLKGLSSAKLAELLRTLSECGKREEAYQYALEFGVDAYLNTLDDAYLNTLNMNYTIGGKGPAGGWVFYDKGCYSEGWRYLEAAPADLSERYVWGPEGELGTATGIGTGRSNTDKIPATRGSSKTAAQACREYSVNGYDDWFLPSADELNRMYLNLKSKGIGGFSSGDYYWSSSDSSSSYGARFQYFYSGGQGSDSRYYDYRVRPVRVF